MKVIKSNWAEWSSNIISYGLSCFCLLVPYFSWYYISNGVNIFKVLLFAIIFFISIFIIAGLIGLIIYIITYPFSSIYIIKGYDYFIYNNNKIMFSDIKKINYNFSESGRNHYTPSYAYILYNNDYLKIEKFSPWLLFKIKQYNPNIRIRFPNFKSYFLILPFIFLVIGIIGTIIDYFI